MQSLSSDLLSRSPSACNDEGGPSACNQGGPSACNRSLTCTYSSAMIGIRLLSIGTITCVPIHGTAPSACNQRGPWACNQTQSHPCRSDAIRRNHLLADQMLVALIRRVHAHSGIAQDRLWSGRGHSHIGLGARFGEHVLEVVELACA